MITFIAWGGLLVVWALGWASGLAYQRHRRRKAERELEGHVQYRLQLAAWWEQLEPRVRDELPLPPRAPTRIKLAPPEQKQLPRGPYR